MNLILTAITLILTAVTAEASVIRYNAEALALPSYAIRYGEGLPKKGVDVRSEYGPRVLGGLQFDIDTDAFTGNHFQYSSSAAADKTGLPAGVSNLPDYAFLEYSVTFDNEWNISEFRAWFDNGSGGENWYLMNEGAYLRNDFGARKYILNPATGKYSEAIDFYGYYARDVTLSKTYVDQAPAPVPLPGSALLLLTAVASVGAIARRRASVRQ